MESACETGKIAAKNILLNQNITNNILVYKMENIESFYYNVCHNEWLFLFCFILLCLSIQLSY